MAARTGSWPTGPGSPGRCWPRSSRRWPGTSARTGRAGIRRHRGAKNAETLTLARRLPDPVARGGGQWLPYPAIVVRLGPADPAEALATARSAFAGDTDCGLWLTGPGGVDVARQLGDPRILAGPVPAAVLARASVLVDLDRPTALTGLTGLAAQAQATGRLRTPAGTITASRAGQRANRWAQALAMTPEQLAMILFGARDRPDPLPTATVDLAHELKQVYRSTSRS